MVDESEAVPNIPLVPDEELDAMKIKISQIKNDIQREKVKDKKNTTKKASSIPHTEQTQYLCWDEMLIEAWRILLKQAVQQRFVVQLSYQWYLDCCTACYSHSGALLVWWPPQLEAETTKDAVLLLCLHGSACDYFQAFMLKMELSCCRHEKGWECSIPICGKSGICQSISSFPLEKRNCGFENVCWCKWEQV